MTLKLAMLDRGTWTVSGVSDEGAWDASAGDPERVRRRDDTIARGFSVNESVDKPADSSSDMSEPGLVPHAYKVAAALRAEARELEKTALSPGKIHQMVLNGAESRLARGVSQSDLHAQLVYMSERLRAARWRLDHKHSVRDQAFQKKWWAEPDADIRHALNKQNDKHRRHALSLEDQLIAARQALSNAGDEFVHGQPRAPLPGKAEYTLEQIRKFTPFGSKGTPKAPATPPTPPPSPPPSSENLSNGALAALGIGTAGLIGGGAALAYPRDKKAAAGVPGLKATVPSLKAPQAPRLPKMQAPKALDPRTDKPPGMNLMHGVTTVSNGSDVGASYTSFSRRLQGSPV